MIWFSATLPVRTLTQDAGMPAETRLKNVAHISSADGGGGQHGSNSWHRFITAGNIPVDQYCMSVTWLCHLTVCTLVRDSTPDPRINSRLLAVKCQLSWLITRCLLLFAVFVGLHVLVGVSLVAIQIYTGRRHQIRAHARFMGWPSCSTSNGAISKSIPMLRTHISDSYLHCACILYTLI